MSLWRPLLALASLGALVAGALLHLAGLPGAGSIVWAASTTAILGPLVASVVRSLLRRDVGVDAIALVAEPIRISYLWRPVLADPGDDLVVETAVNGRADVMVTFNRRHFEPAVAAFGLEILAPAEAVRRLENRS